MSVDQNLLKMKYHPLKWKCFLLVYFVLDFTDFKAVTAGSENREFALGTVQSCRSGGPYGIQFTITNATMLKNRFFIDGEVLVTETQSKDLQLILEYRRCEMKKTKKCGAKMDYVLPKVCVLTSDVGGAFGLKIGHGFVPRWECPVKAGTYKVQIDASLKAIIRIPLSNTFYQTQFLFVNAGKKKPIGCVSGNWWMKDIVKSS